jgi:hypothetical protein
MAAVLRVRSLPCPYCQSHRARVLCFHSDALVELRCGKCRREWAWHLSERSRTICNDVVTVLTLANDVARQAYDKDIQCSKKWRNLYRTRAIFACPRCTTSTLRGGFLAPSGAGFVATAVCEGCGTGITKSYVVLAGSLVERF